MQGKGVEPVEYRVVMRLLCLRGFTQNEALDEMKRVYGENVPSYYVVKHWHAPGH